jgi:hypothetical protein
MEIEPSLIRWATPGRCHAAADAAVAVGLVPQFEIGEAGEARMGGDADLLSIAGVAAAPGIDAARAIHADDFADAGDPLAVGWIGEIEAAPCIEVRG